MALLFITARSIVASCGAFVAGFHAKGGGPRPVLVLCSLPLPERRIGLQAEFAETELQLGTNSKFLSYHRKLVLSAWKISFGDEGCIIWELDVSIRPAGVCLTTKHVECKLGGDDDDLQLPTLLDTGGRFSNLVFKPLLNRVINVFKDTLPREASGEPAGQTESRVGGEGAGAHVGKLQARVLLGDAHVNSGPLRACSACRGAGGKNADGNVRQ